MSDWTLRWPEPEDNLRAWRQPIAVEIETTREIVSQLVPPPRLDILIHGDRQFIIPEIGMGGSTDKSTLFYLALDPGNPNFATSVSDGTLRRIAAHEVNHCLRNAGPGYGTTLGEALVSEGLAGQFVHRLFGTPPEPWERAVEPSTLARLLPDAATLGAPNTDHAAWFYGAGGKYPRWLGYTLGYTIVGCWLQATPDADGLALAHVPADEVLAAWRRSAPRRSMKSPSRVYH